MRCPNCGEETIRIFGEEYCHRCNKRVLKKVRTHKLKQAVNIKNHLRDHERVFIFLAIVIFILLFYLFFLISLPLFR